MKRTTILWITALLLGWCLDFLFWNHSLGINFAIYVELCLAGGLLVLGWNGIKPARESLLLLIPILFFASMSFIRQEPLTLFLSIIMTLGLMGVLAASFLGGRWPWYSLADYLANALRLAGSMIARPLIFRSEQRKSAEAAAGSAAPTGTARPGWKRFWAILRGVIITVPILAVFAALLASADPVFARGLQNLTSLFRLENLPEYIFRLVYILIGAYALAGVFLHAAGKSQDERLFSEKPLIAPFLGFTEAAVVLGAVAGLFAVFVAFQFRYFFGGQTAIGLQGYTYSEYARRGFGELVAVAFCSLLLFLGLSAIVKRQSPGQRRAFSGLGIAMVLLVGVILVSAFQRLLLYEAAYGFSRLRLYTHIFMLWLGLLLAVVAALELLRRQRLFPLAMLLASIGFTASLALVNVDASIVRLNVARIGTGGQTDISTLASLSNDSVPVLVQAYQSPALPLLAREAAAAALVCRTVGAPNPSTADWRAFTLSRYQAGRALEPVQQKLSQYTIVKDAWPVIVTSPRGNKYDCDGNASGN